MDTTVVIAVVAGVPSIIAAAFAYRASSQANAVTARKVDSETFEKAQVFYDKLIASAEKQCDRLQGQVDKMQGHLDQVNTRLATEKDNSATLKNQVDLLQRQVTMMDSTILELRSQLATQPPPRRP